MGFRFRRSVKLLPGVRLNFSTRGVSTSLGGRGATLNIGRRGARATFGLPGTGLSYTTGLLGRSQRSDPAAPSSGSPLLGWIVIGAVLLLIASCMASAGADQPAPEEPTPALTAPTLPTRMVAGAGVNCRAAPVDGRVLAKLDRGATVTVAAQAQGWTKIARPGGDCWVSDTLLTDAT